MLNFRYIFYKKGKQWKLTLDGKLINMVLNESWKYGSKSWSLEDGYIIEKFSKQVMDNEYDLEGEDVILSDKQANKTTQQWEAVKLDGDWIKLKHPKSGFFLHVSEDGERLTIEEYSKGKVHFYLKF